MGTTRDDIRAWIARAPAGTRWMLVICDTYDHSDYPKYFSDPALCRAEITSAEKGENMKKLMECYDLSMDIQTQLGEHRARHFPQAPEPVTKVVSPTYHPPLGIMGGSVHKYVRGKSPWHADAFPPELKVQAPEKGERKEGWFAQDWCGNDIGFFPDGMVWPA